MDRSIDLQASRYQLLENRLLASAVEDVLPKFKKSLEQRPPSLCRRLHGAEERMDLDFAYTGMVCLDPRVR